MTTFPDAATTKLHLKLLRPTQFTLKLRHPGWSRTATVLVNGVEAAASARPGSYIDLTRNWNNGDQIDLRLVMAASAETAPAAPDVVAFTYGPLVLAGALGNEGLAAGSDIVVNERKYGSYNDSPFTAPTLAGNPQALAKSIRAGDEPLEFTIASEQGGPVRLIPYYRIAHERYATYWQVGPDGIRNPA
jgi:DUF1680 family protein